MSKSPSLGYRHQALAVINNTQRKAMEAKVEQEYTNDSDRNSSSGVNTLENSSESTTTIENPAVNNQPVL